MTHAHIQEAGSELISQEHAELLMEVSVAVGRKFAWQFPFLEAEDISSEIHTQALAGWKSVGKQLAKAAEHGQTEYAVLHFLLSQRANVHCGKQHYRYTVESSQVLYTPREVRALLQEYYYNPDAYTTPSKDEDYGVGVEAKSVWANLADINQALLRVSDRVHDTILAAFGPEDLELPEPDKRRVSEAVSAVTRELNRRLNPQVTNHEGPGRRKAVTNASAQAATSNAYTSTTARNALENK